MSNVTTIYEHKLSLADGLKEIIKNNHMTKLMAEMAIVDNFLEYLENGRLIPVDDVKFKEMREYALVNDCECSFEVKALMDYFMDRWSVIYNKMQDLKNSKGA